MAASSDSLAPPAYSAAVYGETATRFASISYTNDTLVFSAEFPIEVQAAIAAAFDALGRAPKWGPSASVFTIANSPTSERVQVFSWKFKGYPMSYLEVAKFMPVVLNTLEANGFSLVWSGSAECGVLVFAADQPPRADMSIVGVTLKTDTVYVGNMPESEPMHAQARAIAAAVEAGLVARGFEVQRTATESPEAIAIKMRGYPFLDDGCASMTAAVPEILSELGLELFSSTEELLLLRRVALKGAGQRFLCLRMVGDRISVSGPGAAETFAPDFAAFCERFGFGDVFAVQKLTADKFPPGERWAGTGEATIKMRGYPFFHGPAGALCHNAFPFVLEFVSRVYSTRYILSRVASSQGHAVVALVPLDGLNDQRPVSGRGRMRSCALLFDTAHVSGNASPDALHVIERGLAGPHAHALTVQKPWASLRSSWGTRRSRFATRSFCIKFRGYPFRSEWKTAGWGLARLVASLAASAAIELPTTGVGLVWRASKDRVILYPMVLFRELGESAETAPDAAYAPIANVLLRFGFDGGEAPADEPAQPDDKWDDTPPPDYTDAVGEDKRAKPVE